MLKYTHIHFICCNCMANIINMFLLYFKASSDQTFHTAYWWVEAVTPRTYNTGQVTTIHPKDLNSPVPKGFGCPVKISICPVPSV